LNFNSTPPNFNLDFNFHLNFNLNLKFFGNTTCRVLKKNEDANKKIYINVDDVDDGDGDGGCSFSS
jgi:hypothetical protein